MAKAICKSCRHFVETGNPFWAAYCNHSFATTIDRVWGPRQPRLDGMVPPEKVKAVTDQCDKEGWFEAPPRKRWML